VSDPKDFEVPPPPAQPSGEAQWDRSLLVAVFIPGLPYPVAWPALRPGQLAAFTEADPAWQAMGWPQGASYSPNGFGRPGPEFHPGGAPYPVLLPPGFPFPPAAQTPPT
jgi:hypothetical protein